MASTAFAVEVEVNCGYGETFIALVGLADAAVEESVYGVSTALANSGFNFPMGKTAINFAPADIKKGEPSFDLPIAFHANSDGKTDIRVPAEDAAEATVVPGLNVIPVQNLREAAQFLEGGIRIKPRKVDIEIRFDPARRRIEFF